MLARPQFKTDQRPDSLGVIAAADLVLMQHRVHFRRTRPAALLRAGIGQDLASPADHAFLEPASQRNTEATLRPRQDVGGHPWRDHFAEQTLGRVGITMAGCRLRAGDFDDMVIE